MDFCGVIFSPGTGGPGSVPSHTTTPDILVGGSIGLYISLSPG